MESRLNQLFFAVSGGSMGRKGQSSDTDEKCVLTSINAKL
jgi:hypothetical protein